MPDEDVERAVLSNPGYVGPSVCGECHGPRLAEFQQTRHFRACWTPQKGPMPVGFTTQHAMQSPRYPDQRFNLSLQGKDFIQTVIHDTPAGERRQSFHIDLVYGSGGQADEVYFTWKGDHLYELPMGYLHPSKEWAEQSFDPDERGTFLRTTTLRCVECHNTWFEYVLGTENEYHHDNFILGVTCEKCHGPGRDHVAFHREHPEAISSHGIVHPRRLSRDRRMDLCGQCHSNAILHRRPAFSYRPGEPLDDYFRTLAADGIENDHVANQVKYLRQSKCYQKSDTLTCTTCHNPHRQTDPEAVARACLKCHQPGHCREQDHLPEQVRNQCVACHMPRNYRVAVKFHTADDQYVFPLRPHVHRIAVYPAAQQEVLLKWYRSRPDAASRQKADQLAKSLLEYWLGEGDKLRRDYRFLASIGALREAVRLNPTPIAKARLKEVVAIQAKLDRDLATANRLRLDRQYTKAIEILTSILKTQPTLARAHGKLGSLYAIVGQPDRATEHLKAVARYDPDDAYGENMLGWLAYLNGNAEEAVTAFRRANEIFPFTAEINYRWGLALLRLEKWEEADARFEQAVQINPNHAGGWQGLSHARRRQRRVKDAVQFARRAARLTHFKNVDVLLSLVDAYSDAGRLREAVETAQQALKAAASSAPEQITQIHQRLQELKSRAD